MSKKFSDAHCAKISAAARKRWGDPVKRFWTGVQIDDLVDCWLWMRRKNSEGYGNIRWYGETWLTHRVAWNISRGEIPQGMLVCHHCDNPPCVNPSHLFLGTDLDNARDKIAKGRSVLPPSFAGEKNPMATLTAPAVLEIRRLYKEGATQISLCRKFEASQTQIWLIVHNRRWKHLLPQG